MRYVLKTVLERCEKKKHLAREAYFAFSYGLSKLGKVRFNK